MVKQTAIKQKHCLMKNDKLEKNYGFYSKAAEMEIVRNRC